MPSVNSQPSVVTQNLQAQLTAATALSPTARANILSWLNNDQLADCHQEIMALIVQQDWPALNDAFYTQIEFGTAGIRGQTGLGSARINRWTVGTVAQGLADYLASLDKAAQAKGVVIGSDTRLTSPEFVQLVAQVLTANGLKIYRFKRTPQVGMFSYAIRLYQAQAGIYISASHNPPNDNGLKLYWADGAQVLPPHDKAIAEAVKKVTLVNQRPAEQKLVNEISEQFDSDYRARVLHESVSHHRAAAIVYSPFHGTGQYGVLPILEEAGFSVSTVALQMAPDGHFPNIPGGVPNPQNRESNQLTAEQVLAEQADLGISTDPDADRLGLVVPRGQETVILDGNETATLLAYFICQQLKAAHQLPANGFLVRTMVTTPILDAIAADFGLKCYSDLPVGFKYIGETIRLHEDEGDELFIFGGEESFGSLKGSYARDKDASVAALLAAELVAWLKSEGRTVWGYLDEIYGRYGYYDNSLVDLKFEGASGFETMTGIMASLRHQPPQELGAWRVERVTDRQTNEIRSATGQLVGKVEGHLANVIVFELNGPIRATLTVRPSGTEPKLKLYLALINSEAQNKSDISPVIAATKEAAEDLKAQVQATVKRLTQ